MPGPSRISAPYKTVTASEVLTGAQHPLVSKIHPFFFFPEQGGKAAGRAFCGGYFAPSPHAGARRAAPQGGVLPGGSLELLGWLEPGTCTRAAVCKWNPARILHAPGALAACVCHAGGTRTPVGEHACCTLAMNPRTDRAYARPKVFLSRFFLGGGCW